MKTSLKIAIFSGLFCNLLTAQTTIEPVWAYYADASNSDNVTDLWVNPEGETYIAGNIGFITGNPNMDGMMVTKTSADGQEIWRHIFYASTTDWGLFASGIVGDESGNIFVIYNEAYRYSGYSNNRIAVRKYDLQGNLLWSNFYTEAANGPINEIARRSAIYKNGILYFASTSTSVVPNEDLDAMVVKIDGNDGHLIQKLIFDSQYQTDDVFKQVCVSDNGDVWAVGRSRGYMYPGGIYSHYDATIVKYDANGVFQWEHRENGASNSEDYGINIAIDASGNCYTSNQLRHLGISQRFVHIQKLSPAGNVLWSHEYHGSSSGYTWDQPVSVLPNGNVAVTVSNENGIVTMLLNGASGDQLWLNNYNRNDMGAANHQRDMITDASGNIYVTGVSRDNTPFGAGYDMVTLKYDVNGNLVWLSNFDNGNYLTMGDDGVRMMLDGSGNLYAIGWTSYGEDYNNDFLLLKYGTQSLGIAENELQQVKAYPNPATTDVSVQFPKHVRLVSGIILVDVNGRTVKNWDAPLDVANIATLDLGGISSGLYFLKAKTDAGILHTKLIKG